MQWHALDALIKLQNAFFLIKRADAWHKHADQHADRHIYTPQEYIPSKYVEYVTELDLADRARSDLFTRLSMIIYKINSIGNVCAFNVVQSMWISMVSLRPQSIG